MQSLKTLFILTLFFYSFSGFSQSGDDTSIPPTTKGNFIVGGSSSFNFSSESLKVKSDNIDDIDLGTNTFFSIAPSTGYFVIDNLAVGAEVAFSTGKFKSDDSDLESKSTSIIASPFVRYYFGKTKIKPFLEGSIGFGSLKAESENVIIGDDIINSTETRRSIFAYGFNGGVAFFLNDFVSVDLGIGYISTSSKDKDDNESNFRNINNTITFNAGFNVFF
ncbi:hypothetical protein GCM10011344_12530 [Dokdonia pacifica]|uniref:Outer membrane protein n=1 Tax=Dokdonia pacifica TaxID=1627892 RepID=A0A238WBE8_9FLAO|nr:outer membrane beta-barrel protein [Dokdonia pacifica]GGG13348.1 hypothetical protein GCM10011344_12530 [Dokdonia pacifica]SNR43818.1 outer membrane protein [Dokdonia pacifica]